MRKTVVAALIKDEKDRILICQRPKNKKRGLLWEFVGGKVEKGESLSEALVRECREELGVDVSPGKIFMQVDHDYPDIKIRLVVIESKLLAGPVRLLEHEDYRWVSKDELDRFKFCPADTEVLERLKSM